MFAGIVVILVAAPKLTVCIVVLFNNAPVANVVPELAVTVVTVGANAPAEIEPDTVTAGAVYPGIITVAVTEELFPIVLTALNDIV